MLKMKSVNHVAFCNDHLQQTEPQVLEANTKDITLFFKTLWESLL